MKPLSQAACSPKTHKRRCVNNAFTSKLRFEVRRSNIFAKRGTRPGVAFAVGLDNDAATSSVTRIVHQVASHVHDVSTAAPAPSAAATSQPVVLPTGVKIEKYSQHQRDDLPFLLYLPDIDGAGVTSRGQWQAWAERFDLYTLNIDEGCTCSFQTLASAASLWLKAQLPTPPAERPIYLLGEGFGGVLALQLAWECRKLVNRLILVNPATSYADSQLARITALLERIPPALLNVQLPAPPLPLPPLPALSSLPLLPPLPLALAPLLGTSPQTLLRQVANSIASQQPAEAVQALNRALSQVELLSSCLTPSAFLHRLRMLDQGISMVTPRLARIPQRTMLLVGGQDVVLGSEEEAKRLEETLQRAFKKVLPDSGHALLYEPGGDLLSLLDEAGFYITRRNFSSPVQPGTDVNAFGSAGPVEIPTPQEVQRYATTWTARLRELNSPVFLSTRPDGTRVMGLEGLPSRRRGHSRSQETLSDDHHTGDLGHSTSLNTSTGINDGNGATVADGLGAPAGVSSDTAWGDGPLLFVGNHQLYAFDMSVMVEEVLDQTGILMRGLAHPGLFQQGGEVDEDRDKDGNGTGARAERDTPGPAGGRGAQNGSAQRSGGGTPASSQSGKDKDGGKKKDKDKEDDGLPPAFMGNMFQSFGAVRVTPTAMFRLLAVGEAVLLYPGGVREGFKRRNEKYELFWPSKSEFVRMAARFGATIIPVSAVGLEDSLQLLMDSDDIMRNPFLGARAREQAASTPRARIGVAEGAGLDETFVPPIIAPAVPARFYFLFGRPIRTSKAMYKDREACDEVYQSVKAEVQDGISYLLRKREQDPYRDFLTRYIYEQNPPFGPRRKAPTFQL